MHQSSYISMERFEKNYLSNLRKDIKILDIGSQDVNGSYKDIFSNPKYKYYGADAEKGKNVDIILNNPYNWNNIKSSSFDVVISGQAFEHIEYFWITMSEIIRVLKPAGLCCIIAPSSGIEHKYPVDCWRIYPDGFYALANLFDFKVIENFLFVDFHLVDDNSLLWRDTVFIGKKGKNNLLKNTKFKILNYILKHYI
jgi:SAM-dependent methyltransferase